jgi:hypothetical protein
MLKALNGIVKPRRLYKGSWGQAGENLAAGKMGDNSRMRIIVEGIAAGPSKEVA